MLLNLLYLGQMKVHCLLMCPEFRAVPIERCIGPYMKSFGMLCEPLAMHLNSVPSRLTSSGYLHSTTLPRV